MSERVSMVEMPARDPALLADLLSPEQAELFRSELPRAAQVFEGRTIWNVNSTAKGGGVAEMLASLVPYARGARVDARWAVINGDPGFFRVTKRIHNQLHGDVGDGGPLGDEERSTYEDTLQQCAEELAEQLDARDLAILHDPQTAGLIPRLRALGIPVVWRCHVGLDVPNATSRRAWQFLLPYVSGADACVFSRQAYVWDGLDSSRTVIIAPAIDPLSPKNLDLDVAETEAILRAAGLAGPPEGGTAYFQRGDGSRGRIQRHARVYELEHLDDGVPLVLQVSRWDRLKDPHGVLAGFAEHAAPRCSGHLMLAGPSVEEVADDPEGAEVFAEVRRMWEALPEQVRGQVHIASLPMDDSEENAAMVNALQHRATVVVQKSLAEGFGLTVAEAMWKGRPVVASRIGGIADQIEDGVTGVLLDDPTDLACFGQQVCDLVNDPARAEAMGTAARLRVRDHFLAARQLMQYVELLSGLLERPVPAAEASVSKVPGRMHST